MYRQNRRPDEEGIKTPGRQKCCRPHGGQNRRPDEEGIKTQVNSTIHYSAVRTVDLMKKGLRQS